MSKKFKRNGGNFCTDKQNKQIPHPKIINGVNNMTTIIITRSLNPNTKKYQYTINIKEENQETTLNADRIILQENNQTIADTKKQPHTTHKRKRK